MILLPLLIGTRSSFGGTLTFDFSGTADATAFGLSANEPFSVIWSYDPTQAPGSTVGGPPPFRVAYYNIEAVWTVGSYTVTTSSLIGIDNNNPGTNDDSFQIGAANYLVGTTITGAINGIDVADASLTINDTSETMFSSTALPTDTSFINSATFIAIGLSDFSNQKQISQQFDANAVNFQVIPEPGTLTLGLLACALLVPIYNRKTKTRDRQAFP